MAKCILCNAKATINVQDNASRTIYNCQNCGVFVVSDLVVSQAKKYGNELAAYFTSRKLVGLNEVVLVSFDKAVKDKDYIQLTVDQILSQFPHSFSELADRILVNLSLMSGYAGEEIKVDGLEMCPIFYVKKQNYDALSFIIKSLQKFELIEVNYYGSSFFPCGVIVSPRGWDRLSELEEGNTSSSTALLYVPGNDDEYTAIFRKVARKAARECGYQAVEAGALGVPNLVNHEKIGQIRDCKFIICGMTRASCGTYYAAGMAAALNKTTILTCHNDFMEELQIDANQISVLGWDDEKQLYLQILNAIRALVR